MEQHRHGTAARWGRLAVLLVFVSGFLTMHGFLAVSASAEVHVTHQVAAGPATHASDAHGTPTTATSAAQQDLGAGHGPLSPAEHHELVAGCVIALVGIGLLALRLLSLRRSWSVPARPGLLGGPSHAIRASVARWSPPRVALCVIRV